jgi:hypothetical protein
MMSEALAKDASLSLSWLNSTTMSRALSGIGQSGKLQSIDNKLPKAARPENPRLAHQAGSLVVAVLGSCWIGT